MASVAPDEAARQIKDHGLIAIARGDFTPTAMCALADALEEGGGRIVEIALGSGTALKCIEALRRHADGRLLVGAGTVRTPEDVERAVGSGAQFLISPNVDRESMERSRDAGVLHLPGVFTASEAQEAVRGGCRMQKLFPADHAGPSYMKALSAPLGDVEFVPTGGIDTHNLTAFVHAGAVALGVGSALITGPHQEPGRVTKRARKIKSVLDVARSSRRVSSQTSRIEAERGQE